MSHETFFIKDITRSKGRELAGGKRIKKKRVVKKNLLVEIEIKKYR